jgi:hypothetical protein
MDLLCMATGLFYLAAFANSKYGAWCYILALKCVEFVLSYRAQFGLGACLCHTGICHEAGCGEMRTTESPAHFQRSVNGHRDKSD